MVINVTLSDPTQDIALYPLIEEVGMRYIPAKQVLASSYYNGHDVARSLGIDSNYLLYMCQRSKRIHAVLLPTGAFFIHPHGLYKYIASQMKKDIAKLRVDC